VCNAIRNAAAYASGVREWRCFAEKGAARNKRMSVAY